MRPWVARRGVQEAGLAAAAACLAPTAGFPLRIRKAQVVQVPQELVAQVEEAAPPEVQVAAEAAGELLHPQIPAE